MTATRLIEKLKEENKKKEQQLQQTHSYIAQLTRKVNGK